MSTDRELLELAAKAAGLEIESWGEMNGNAYGWHVVSENVSQPWWPLTDDGAALRLAVKLRLVIHVWDDEGTVSVAKTLHDGNDPEVTSAAWHAADSHECGGIEAATRRAIVLAAADIGRKM